MSTFDAYALVLAAGKGTRMHSHKPKVLKTILGEPMLLYVYNALEPSFGSRIKTVVGFGADQVEQAFPAKSADFVLQEQQLGTGHALQVAWDELKSTGCTHCFVINGDTPLVGEGNISAFLERMNEDLSHADVVFMTIHPKDMGQFGRVVRDEDGRVLSIVEAKDYDIGAHGVPTGEVNAGIYCLKMETVEPLLRELSNKNNSGEYYITDLVDLGVRHGLNVAGVPCGDDPNLMGINSPRELVEAEEELRSRIVRKCIDSGVIVRQGATVCIGPRVNVEPGAEICGPCKILGESVIHSGVHVGPFNYVLDSVLESNCWLREYSHVEGALVGPDAIVGPYARLRPGAVLRDGSKVGNFVEIKKAEVGPGAKVNHLTYVGDAEIGARTNVGAGTITCNYDGKNKFRTVIGEDAFIGSNTALVAPVNIGAGALIGAGSTITKDVPEGDLGIARARQKNIGRKKGRS